MYICTREKRNIYFHKDLFGCLTRLSCPADSRSHRAHPGSLTCAHVVHTRAHRYRPEESSIKCIPAAAHASPPLPAAAAAAVVFSTRWSWGWKKKSRRVPTSRLTSKTRAVCPLYGIKTRGEASCRDRDKTNRRDAVPSNITLSPQHTRRTNTRVIYYKRTVVVIVVGRNYTTRAPWRAAVESRRVNQISAGRSLVYTRIYYVI